MLGVQHKRTNQQIGRSTGGSICCGTAASARTSRSVDETHLNVGEKANDAVRVDDADVRFG